MADDDVAAAGLLASGGGRVRPGGGAMSVADDNAEEPVAGGTGTDARNAVKDSQTGQSVPVQVGIAGTTFSRMVAKALGARSSWFRTLRQTCT